MAFENDQIVSNANPAVQSFVDTYKPVADSVGKELNVDPGILLGKWGNETGWGKNVIPDTYNLGNIKDFSGGGVQATDNVTKSKDRYKKYSSPEEFGQDYTKLIRSKYPNAVGAGSDVDKFTAGLTGYAEDPNYSTKVSDAYKRVGSLATKDDPFANDKIVSKANEDPFAKDKIVTPSQDETDPFAKDKIISSPSVLGAAKAEYQEEKQNFVDTFLSHGAAGILPAMGGFAGAKGLTSVATAALGATPEGRVLKVAFPIITNLVGSGVGYYATNKIERNLLPESINHHLEVGEQQNKYAAQAGDILGFAAVGGVAVPETLKQAAFAGSIGVGIEGFQQWMSGEYDPTALLINAVTFPFLGDKPTKLGRLATLEPLRSVKPKQNIDDILKKDLYTPKTFNDYNVVDLDKESIEDYAKRHGLNGKEEESDLDAYKKKHNIPQDAKYDGRDTEGNFTFLDSKNYVHTAPESPPVPEGASYLGIDRNGKHLYEVIEGKYRYRYTSEFNPKQLELVNRLAKEQKKAKKVDPDTVQKHRANQSQYEDPVRPVTSVADGSKHLEVDKKAIMEHFKDKRWEFLYNLPKNYFKTPQAYTDFLLNRASIKEEMPFEDWYKANPSVNSSLTYDSRKSFYTELNDIKTKAILGEASDADLLRYDELIKQGPPQQYVDYAEHITPDELKGIIVGSKNIGEAIDRIVAGKFGGKVEQEIFKLLQKGKWLSSAELNLFDTLHPDGPNVPAEYDPNTHAVRLFNGADLPTFAHEIFHAGTIKALDDPANAKYVEELENLLNDIKDVIPEEEHWKEWKDENGKTVGSGIYGTKNIAEFISEGYTSDDFRRILQNIVVKRDGPQNKLAKAWDEFKNILKDLMGISNKDEVTAFDKLMDLTHDMVNGNDPKAWGRGSITQKFGYNTDAWKQYESELNKQAIDAAQANPFFNMDVLNIPPLPENEDGMADWLFNLQNIDMYDEVIAKSIRDQVDLTPEQSAALQHFVEGLHRDHVELHTKANNIDNEIKQMGKGIGAEYFEREFQSGTTNREKYNKLKDIYNRMESDNPKVKDTVTDEENKYFNDNKDFWETSRTWQKTVAERLEAMKQLEKDAADLRALANQGTTLTPEEQDIFDRIYKPLLETRVDITKFLMREGVMKNKTLSENNFPRQREPMSKDEIKAYEDKLIAKGLKDPEPTGLRKLYSNVKNFIGELGGGDKGGFNFDLQKQRGAAKDRSVFVLEAADGKRSVIEVKPGGNVIKWENVNGEKEPSLLTRLVSPTDGSRATLTGALDVGDKLLNGTVVEGTVPEIEFHSPFRYKKDSLSVLLNSVNELKAQARYYQGIKNLTESDLFKSLARPAGPKDELPDGYSIPDGLDRLPALRGWAFPNKLSEVITDFAKVKDPTFLTNMASLIVKNMMLNPLGHMYNEGMHLGVGRGLSGWVTPAGIYRFVKYGKQAIDDVLGMSSFYTDTIKYGGSILGESTRNSTFGDAIYNKGLREFSKTQDFKDLAKDTGRTLLNMYDVLSEASGRAMWMSRNIMYLQWLREVMATKGLSHPEAIEYVEKHMPNYRVPSRIGEKVLGSSLSRGIASVMKNPNITVFSPYHYGYLKSMINTVKEVGSGLKGAEGNKEFREGIDRVAAMAVIMACFYPLMDMLAQRMTGNENARQRRAGPFHLMDAIGEVADGTKDPQAVLSAFFTFNPALQGMVQFGIDRNIYTGQQIYNLMSEPSVITKDILRYFTQQVPQASQVFQATKDDSGEGAQVFGARQLDIESKTSIQQSKIDRMIRKLRKRALKHDIKREEDIL